MKRPEFNGRTQRLRPASHTMALTLVLALGLCTAPLSTGQAQGLTKQFGGFAADQNAPIEIEAERLDVNDKAKTAVFTGSVVAKQGEFTIRSRILTVHYTGDAAGTSADSDQNIKRIIAEGKVIVVNGKSNSARGDRAEFDVAKQIITLSGNVFLDQCGNSLKGSALQINLITGKSQLKNTNSGGRVSAVFVRGGDRKKKKKKAAAKAGAGC